MSCNLHRAESANYVIGARSSAPSTIHLMRRRVQLLAHLILMENACLFYCEQREGFVNKKRPTRKRENLIRIATKFYFYQENIYLII